MNNIEDKIRDKLCENLKLINPSLKLIAKEYYLPKAKTTKGFIDILASDKDNNYVIIEVKRSNQSAREAIHEIYKYTESLKEKKKLTLGEIKSIIISTEWDELYIPFSSFANETEISIEGYHLIIDTDLNIKNISKVIPCRTNKGRIFSPIQECCLYKNKQNLDKGIESHFEVFKTKSIHDFVLVILKAPKFDKEKYKEDLEQMLATMLGKDKSEFKGNFDNLEDLDFMIYSAFQRLTIEEYYDILKKDEAQYRETKEYVESLETTDEEDILSALENSVLGNLKPWFYSNHTEIGYPAKFAHKILEDEKWQVLEIIRSDSLRANSLLTDDKIISEMKGYTGVSNVKLHDNCDTSHKAKFIELKNNATNALKHNVVWQNHVIFFLNSITDLGPQLVEVDIYSPSHILLTIIKMTTEDSTNWLPNYVVAIKDSKSEKFYLGSFHWNRKKCKFSKLVKKYYNGDPANILMSMIWGGHESENDKMLDDLGLSYQSYLIERKNGSEQYYLFENFKFRKVKAIKNELFDFINESPEIIQNLLFVYSNHFHKAEIKIIE